ncbi:MAG: HAD-IB family hydrolase [Coriobacteriales bacterium]|nr:HAD-IB family hydrolase [Coriobacteriales bacterium]
MQPAAEPQPAPAPPPTTEPQHTAAAPPPAQPSAAAPPPQPTTNPVRIVAFDFDGTLIDASSPVRLIFRLTRERIMPVLVGMRIGIWGARYKMGSELDQSLPRGIIFRSLRRVSAADADALLRSLYREELRQSLRPQALEELARHKRDGAEVLIASASFEPIISEVARDLGADGFISTQMEVADGCYTGKTIGEPPEGEQKLLQLKQYADERYGVGNWVLEWAYGDHFSDIPLLEGATHAVAVDPDRRLDRIARSRGWSIVEWELPGGREVTIGADIIASLLGKAPKRPGGPKTADRRRKR